MKSDDIVPQHSQDQVEHPFPDIFEAIRTTCKAHRLTQRTEAAYSDWIYRYLTFHSKRQPNTMGRKEISAFLSYLAAERRVSASSQHQARFALLFLYAKVLGIPLEELRYKHVDSERRIPTVLSRAEVKRVLNHLTNDAQLMASLLYGCGLRLKECIALKVKDIDLEHNVLRVPSPQGRIDRTVLLPKALLPPLEVQLKKVAEKHQENMAHLNFMGAATPPLSSAPITIKELDGQHLFPAPKLFVDASGTFVQRPVNESTLQKALKAALKSAGLPPLASCSTLRHSFAAHLLEAGVELTYVQRLLGQKEVRYTKLYLETLGKVRDDE